MLIKKEVLENLRAEYRSNTLTEDQAHTDPFTLFDRWFSEAINSKILEPNAMTLATADASGKPYARIVLLKGSGPKGFIFYTNYESDKGRQISANPQAALVIAWLELERQIRIEGRVEKVSPEDSAQYFKRRPRSSQIAAIISPQSHSIPNRSFLDDKWRDFDQTHPETELELPSNWGGFLVVPSSIEFWQGRSNRLHDRLLYTRKEQHWMRTRLAP